MLTLLSVADQVVATARDQTTWGTRYDPAYVRIAYPNGDVPRSQGVCTDVVIRAYRAARIDLQRLIVEDKRRHPAAYPAGKLDPNIDHRRVPNQRAFFRRHGATLSLSGDFRAGDIVDWKLPSGRDHTGIVSDRRDAAGTPLVIHNIGAGPREEDVLKSWPIVAHFRYPATPKARSSRAPHTAPRPVPGSSRRASPGPN